MVNQSEVDKLAEQLKISKEEALDIWLTDRGLSINEEQEKLDNFAKNVKKEPKRKKVAPKKCNSQEKFTLFESILQNLDRCEGVERENIQVSNYGKLIYVKMNEKTFKIDLIEQRPPKN